MKPSPFKPLFGDEQIDEYAQLLLRSDKSIPKKIEPYVPFQPFNNPISDSFIKSVSRLREEYTKNPFRLEDIVSIQPMKAPLSSSFLYMDYHADSWEVRRKKEMEELSQYLKDGEILKEYEYGEILAQRGGYFIVHKDEPNRVLAVHGTWMS